MPLACTSDIECAMHFSGTCNAPADKLRRDVQRVEDLALLQRAITNVTEGRRRCSVTERWCNPAAVAGAPESCPSGEACVALPPALASGTFLSGMTTSKWPSWQQELGRELGITLPTDPLNIFGGQCVANPTLNTAYEQTTCWSATGAQYTCPAGSHVYQYERKGNYVELGVEFEYRSPSPENKSPLELLAPSLPITGLVRVKENICVSTTLSTRDAVCGDGLVQSPEMCEPGITPPQMAACTAAGGVAGFATRSCTSSCIWTIADSDWNGTIPEAQCGVTCRNGVVDGRCSTTTSRTCRTNDECPLGESCTVEQCDVGRDGGRVPTRGGTVPGITPGTQYACTAACLWTGGSCGDGALQSGYGERCDPGNGTAALPAVNIATTPDASSMLKQYACDTQCRPTSGYCGDFIVQNGTGSPPTFNAGETCDGDRTRSCIVGGDDETGIKAYLGKDFFTSGADALGSGADVTAQYNARYDSGPSSPSGYTDAAMANVNSVWYIPVSINTNGDVRIVLTTSDDNGDVESLSMAPISDASAYNPDGDRGTGIYHRLYIAAVSGDVTNPSTCTSASCFIKKAFSGPYWVRATAPSNPQRTEIVLQDVPSTMQYLALVWNNDLNNTSSPAWDSNFVVHAVELQSLQTRDCHDPGTTNACTIKVDWGTCQASSRCGNGKVDTDAGEVCDDSRADGAFAGRCSNDAKKQCYRKPDGSSEGCADGGTCEPNADACTTQCRANACGDSYQLVAQSCIAGANIGKTCRTNADCGAGGVCAQEACDQGVAENFTPTQLASETCTYGRTCNYCTTRCTIATKQGGFCGDRVLQAPVGAKRCQKSTAGGRPPNTPILWTCVDDDDCGDDGSCVAATLPIGSEICERGTKITTTTTTPSKTTTITCNDSCTGPR